MTTTDSDLLDPTREATRELRGTVKDARAVLTELRAAMAEVGLTDGLPTGLRETINALLDGVNERLDKMMRASAHVYKEKIAEITESQVNRFDKHVDSHREHINMAFRQVVNENADELTDRVRKTTREVAAEIVWAELPKMLQEIRAMVEADE